VGWDLHRTRGLEKEGAEEGKDRTDVVGRCICARWVSRSRDCFSFLLESDRDRKGKARLVRLQ
jgi:hypothetical protein